MRLDEIIDEVYDAALQPERWPDALHSIARSFDAVGVTLVPLRDAFTAMSSPGCSEALGAYAERWWSEDTLVEIAAERRVSGFCADWDLIDRRRMDLDPFYQDFRRPFGIGHCLAFLDRGEGADAIALSLHMPLGWTVETGGADHLSVVGKHVGRAAKVMRLTAAARAADALLEEVLCALPFGAALIDASGQVLLANRTLESFGTDGLRVEKRRLRAATPRSQATLDRVVAPPSDFRSVQPGAVAQLARPSGRRPLLVCVTPLGREGRAMVDGRGLGASRSIVFVIDGEAELAARSEVKLSELGLTPSEARLAALIGAGRSPAQAAAALNITENTVRTTMKRIFEKMSVSRQSELSYIVGRWTALP